MSVLGNGKLCAPDDPRLLAWLAKLRVSVLPCQSPRERRLPRALIREDGNGLSLALPDDLRNPLAVKVSNPSVVTASVTAGWLELMPRGRGSAEVEIVPSGTGSPATARVTVRAGIGTFGIDIVMQEPAPSGYAETFVTIADWWSAVLDGTEWPDRSTTFRVRELAGIRAVPDELIIYAGTDLDPDQAAPGYARIYQPVSGLPIGGEVWVRQGAGTGLGLIMHEIGHLLGLVGRWPAHLVTERENAKYFVGPRAVQAFRAGGGDSSLPGVPMDGSHWKKGHVSDFMGGGQRVEISFSALQDAGYTVDTVLVVGRAKGGVCGSLVELRPQLDYHLVVRSSRAPT